MAYGLRDERTKGRRDEETKGRRDEGTKRRRDEGTKGLRRINSVLLRGKISVIRGEKNLNYTHILAIMIKVIGIKIIDRIKEAGLTQGILSHHANVITTRLGFHEVTEEVCSREAYIILHLNGDPADTENLTSELRSLEGIEIREMTFTSEKETLNVESVKNSVEILGILVERDPSVVLTVQKLLTSYGCNIRTRVGVNEVFFGEPAGLIILELKGDEKQRLMLEKDLKALKQVHVRSMVF